MHSLPFAVIVRSDGGLLLATAGLAVLMVYELVSGNLVGGSWNVWATRRDRPILYWSVVGVKAAFILGVGCTFCF
jgi:hypothetical protein